MTVGQLIQKLKECPADAKVYFTAEAGQVLAEVIEADFNNMVRVSGGTVYDVVLLDGGV